MLFWHFSFFSFTGGKDKLLTERRKLEYSQINEKISVCNVLTVVREGKSKPSENTNLDKLNMASVLCGYVCVCLGMRPLQMCIIRKSKTRQLNKE